MSGRENRDLSLQAQGTAQDAGETRGQAQRQARGGMTNRERIMQEMAVMSDQDLSKLLTEDHGDRLTDRLCYACEERHGGKCPLGMDDCLLWDGSWLRDEWDGKSLLLEVGT